MPKTHIVKHEKISPTVQFFHNLTAFHGCAAKKLVSSDIFYINTLKCIFFYIIIAFCFTHFKIYIAFNVIICYNMIHNHIHANVAMASDGLRTVHWNKNACRKALSF